MERTILFAGAMARLFLLPITTVGLMYGLLKTHLWVNKFSALAIET
jgi:hypothetical protein